MDRLCLMVYPEGADVASEYNLSSCGPGVYRHVGNGPVRWHYGDVAMGTEKRNKMQSGYIRVHVGNHHLADKHGWALEHRLVAEEKLGRRLRNKEEVHHIDGDRANNNQSNLIVAKSHAHHAVLHRYSTGRKAPTRVPGEMNPVIVCACGCRESFLKYDHTGRARKWAYGHHQKRQKAASCDAVLALLKLGPMRRKKIAVASGLTSGSVGCALLKLSKRGLIVNVCRGIWRLA